MEYHHPPRRQSSLLSALRSARSRSIRSARSVRVSRLSPRCWSRSRSLTVPDPRPPSRVELVVGPVLKPAATAALAVAEARAPPPLVLMRSYVSESWR